MRVEEKLEAFEKMALTAAEAEKSRASEELEKRFIAMVEEAARDEERKSHETIRSARYKIEREMNKRIVDASGGAKREFITWRDKLTEDLFKDVLKDLRSFVASPEYEAFLTERIKTAAGTGRYEAVQLTAADMRRAAAITDACGLTAEQATDDFIGGFRLIGEGRRSVTDHTIAGKLNEQKSTFSLMASSYSS